MLKHGENYMWGRTLLWHEFGMPKHLCGHTKTKKHLLLHNEISLAKQHEFDRRYIGRENVCS